jgi:AcrR family transcriptional regulator
VGAFYARFRDKQALLHSLYARYDQSLETRMDELRERASWEGLDLAGSVRLLVEHLVAFFGERLFLMRALALYARTRPDEIDSDARRRRRRQHQFLHSALLTRRDEIHHPEPERAVELAIFFAAAACRDRILFAEAPHSESTRLSTAELVHEVTRMVLGYLQNSPALERRTDH